MVIRMDPARAATRPAASANSMCWPTRGPLPVPEVFWVDPDGRWFPEPALAYVFAEGVAKTGRGNEPEVSGIGTYFPPALRAPLAE